MIGMTEKGLTDPCIIRECMVRTPITRTAKINRIVKMKAMIQYKSIEKSSKIIMKLAIKKVLPKMGVRWSALT